MNQPYHLYIENFQVVALYDCLQSFEENLRGILFEIQRQLTERGEVQLLNYLNYLFSQTTACENDKDPEDDQVCFIPHLTLNGLGAQSSDNFKSYHDLQPLESVLFFFLQDPPNVNIVLLERHPFGEAELKDFHYFERDLD